MSKGYVVVRESEILSKDAPAEYGYWSEEAIRNYQETRGVNYGQAVFVRGDAPNREWSNDRHFGGGTVHQVNTPTEIKTPLVARPQESEVEGLKAQIQSLKEMIAEMAAVKHMPELTSKGLERHGLTEQVTFNVHPSQMDKRTKAYKEWAAEQKQA